MAQKLISVGSVESDATYDSLRTIAIKVNENFSEVYGGDASSFLNDGASAVSRTQAEKLKEIFSVKDYGAKGDATYLGATFTISAGSAALQASANVFTAAMVGKTVILQGAGAAGAALLAIITVYTSATQVTLSVPAATAVAANIRILVGTDDSASINAAITEARTRTIRLATTRYNVALTFPAGEYLTLSPINMTGFRSYGFRVNALGATIHGACVGGVVVDAINSRWLRWTGLDIQGDPFLVPKIGLQIGRTNTTALNSSDNHSFSDSMIIGSFTQSAFHNVNAESSQFSKLHFSNDVAGAYAVTLDGINHFASSSTFVTQSQPVDVAQSFNENLFLNCIFSVNGVGAIPLWIAGAGRLRVISGYSANTAGQYAVALYTLPGAITPQLDMDIHFETNSLTDIFFITGSDPAPAFPGLRFRDNAPFCTNSVFKIDPASSVGVATLHNAEIDIAHFPTATAKLFDEPAKWSGSGTVYLPSSTNWNGVNFTAAVGTPSGMTSYYSLPNPLNANSLAASGGITGLTFTGTVAYRVQASAYWPTVTIPAPPGGGFQATAVVATLSVFGYPNTIVTGGTGYTDQEICSLRSSTGTVLGAMRVTAASGVVTAIAGTSTAPLSGVVPTGDLVLISPSTGSGATVSGMAWRPGTFTVTTAGTNYTTAPTATMSSFGTAGGTLTASTVVDSNFTATGGSGQLLLDNTGSKLGVAGTTGSPAMLMGANIDRSGVRQSLGATYTVPANTSLVRFIQGTTVAASTVTLPTALADGHPIQFSNYAGAITALTFAPVVNGWTNGSTLAAYTGLRIRWDATSAAWFKE